LKRTPFYKFHENNGAKFVEFAGYELPISYGSIIEEHKQTRASGSIFDVSHMGRIKFSGRHARRFLERILTRRVSDMKPQTCRYSLICNEHGGVLDDVLVYRFDNHWLLVVNAANRDKLTRHFDLQKQDMAVKIEDQTDSTGMVAVQGPKVIDMIGEFSKEIPTLKRYTFTTKNLMILKMHVSRTGYTGEDGVEVILGANMAEMAIKLLLKEKGGETVVKPAGLGARDTLRMEAGMPLYGHELDEHTDPLSAGLSFAVSLDKDQDENGEPFVGQDALKAIAEKGPEKKLIGLKLEGKRSPRQGQKVMLGELPIGTVTSGCVSPTLGYPIAMAYVPADKSEEDKGLSIEISGKGVPAERVDLPFYKAPKK